MAIRLRRGMRDVRQRSASVGVRGVVALALMILVVAVAAMGGGCSSALDEAADLEEAGDWEGALDVYKRILAEDGDNLAALSGTAVALMLLNRYDEALAYQEKVIAADPNDVQTRVELGFNYLNHQGRPQDAVRVLTEATTLEPSAKHLCFLAQAQEESGDTVGAEGTLRKAISIDETYAYAYTLLRGLLESEGRDDEAEELTATARAAGVELSGP